MPPKQNTAQKDYETLQLKHGASLDSIKNAYKTLVKIWHPDLFPSDQPKAQEKAHKMFRLFTESYSRLVKYHDEYKESDFSEAYQEPSSWGSSDTQPTQTIEMIDKKWPDGTKYEGMSLRGQFHDVVFILIQMETCMSENFGSVKYKEKDSLVLQMVINMKVRFLKIKCTAKGK